MGSLLVVALAVVLRVSWVLLVPSKPVGDFAMYLESAAHLLLHGSLDPEFVYMPGYVLAVAGVMGLGGGLLAVKLLLGALLGGLGAGAVYGVTASFWGRRAALVAGLAYAVWPAGVAVSSVTGTDLPAAVLVLGAACALTAWGRRRPWLAVVAFGLVMGLAAYVRAVAVPLAAFSLFYFRALGWPWRRVALRAGVSVAIALCVLAPWVLRNRWRYGEWMLTDSHGGLTALVGANPNSEGRYSRSLNRVFKEVTGYTLLAPPHREADRAAYALARELTAFSRPYALGLVALKAERLLDHERALLYWPIYREGVLPAGSQKRWFDRNRRELEAVTDGFWLLLVVAFAAGVGLAVARRRWEALAFLPIQAALVAIYALYFAEVRYHLPIAALMFPVAAGVAAFFGDAVAWLRTRPTAGGAALLRQVGAMALAVLALGLGWLAWKTLGERLRRDHRFAAHVCRVEGRPALCKWKSAGPGPSPVRGVHDGVGLDLHRLDGAGRAAARLSLPVPAGPHVLRAQLDLAPVVAVAGAATAGCWVALGAVGGPAARASLADIFAASVANGTVPVAQAVEARAGAIELELVVGCPPGQRPAGSVWLAGLELARP